MGGDGKYIDSPLIYLSFHPKHGHQITSPGSNKQKWFKHRVVVLDHHKTALETLPPRGTGPANLHLELDMTRSGATIAYDYFLQKLQAQSSSRNLVEGDNIMRVETLFKYIEDADLWTWALPDSKAFSSGLSDCAIEYSVQKNSSVFDQVYEHHEACAKFLAKYYGTWEPKARIS